MQLKDSCFHGAVLLCRGFDKEQNFIRLFPSALPMINGSDRRGDINACRQALVHQMFSKLKGGSPVGGRAESQEGSAHQVKIL